MQRPDRSVYLEMEIRSEVRPNLLKKGILEHGGNTRAKERQLVGALAGAMAEELCEQYADTLEPSAVARTAMDCYDEMVSENPVLQQGNELPRGAGPEHVRMAKH